MSKPLTKYQQFVKKNKHIKNSKGKLDMKKIAKMWKKEKEDAPVFINRDEEEERIQYEVNNPVARRTTKKIRAKIQKQQAKQAKGKVNSQLKALFNKAKEVAKRGREIFIKDKKTGKIIHFENSDIIIREK